MTPQTALPRFRSRLMDARAIRLGLLLVGTIAVVAALSRQADPGPGQVGTSCAGHVILLAGAGCGEAETPSRVP